MSDSTIYNQTGALSTTFLKQALAERQMKDREMFYSGSLNYPVIQDRMPSSRVVGGSSKVFAGESVKTTSKMMGRSNEALNQAQTKFIKVGLGKSSVEKSGNVFHDRTVFDYTAKTLPNKKKLNASDVADFNPKMKGGRGKMSHSESDEEEHYDGGDLIPSSFNFRPPDVTELIQKYGDYQIKKLRIVRKPLNDLFFKLGNLVTLGKLKQLQFENDVDKYFHLFCEMYVVNPETDDSQLVLIEKNQRVNVKYGRLGGLNMGEEAFSVPVPDGLTVEEFIENAEDYAEKNEPQCPIYIYDVRDCNCQVFVRTLLKGNDLWDSSYADWVIQPAKKLMPHWLGKFVKGVTDLAHIVNIFYRGAGMDGGADGQDFYNIVMKDIDKSIQENKWAIDRAKQDIYVEPGYLKHSVKALGWIPIFGQIFAVSKAIATKIQSAINAPGEKKAKRLISMYETLNRELETQKNNMMIMGRDEFNRRINKDIADSIAERERRNPEWAESRRQALQSL